MDGRQALHPEAPPGQAGEAKLDSGAPQPPAIMIVAHMVIDHIPLDVRVFYKECRSLAAAGHDVHLIAAGECDEQRDGVRFHSVGRRVASRVRIRRQRRSDGTTKLLMLRAVNRARIVGMGLDLARLKQAFQSEEAASNEWGMQ